MNKRYADFEPLVRRFEQLANRIVLGIVVVAFINGLAVLLLGQLPRSLDRKTVEQRKA